MNGKYNVNLASSFVYLTLLWITLHIGFGETSITCGQSHKVSGEVVKRILGGHVSSPDQWPWVVNVRVYQQRGHMTCGGGVIGKDWVITAAHCLEQEKYPYGGVLKYVGVGLGRKTGFARSQDGKTIPVDKVIFHPNRLHGERGKIGQHDIALLHLVRPLTSGDGVIPLCLPSGHDDVPAGFPCSIAGWGQQHVFSGASMFLHHVFLKVISNRHCSNILSMKIFSGQMCAMADVDHTSCKGDSGTPLACFYRGRYHLTGIVSLGTPCGIYSDPTPTVLTRVNSYKHWLLTAIQEYEHKAK